MKPHRRVPWLEPGEPFPDLRTAWGAGDPAPGLLAAGGDLSVSTLERAYRHGIFPWYSGDQPVLWWSPDPRMVLSTHSFRLHRSLRKTLQRFLATPGCEVRVDHDTPAVIRACAASERPGQSGTWIVEEMIEAYADFHRAGFVHSVETWIGDELCGGLYCVSIGRAVFGESMFARRTDASKIALAALVALCRAQGASRIDCQQNTRHLASLGAREVPRSDFVTQLASDVRQPPLAWRFEPVYWSQLLNDATPA